MKNNFTLQGFIFVNDRKRGAAHSAGYALCMAYRLYKCGFAHAHFSMKSKYFMLLGSMHKLLYGIIKGFQLKNYIHDAKINTRFRN